MASSRDIPNQDEKVENRERKITRRTRDDGTDSPIEVE
jgi:hypothetical protein